MTYHLRIDFVARRQIREFSAYLSEYDQDFAIAQLQRVREVLRTLAQTPFIWSFHPLAGPPFRGYLFRVGRRTQYWIIYTIDESERTVDVLQFWNASRDPDTLNL